MAFKINKALAVGIVLFICLVFGFAMRNLPFTGGDLDRDVQPIMTSTDVMFFTWKSVSSYRSEMPVLEPSYTTAGINNVISGYPVLMNTFSASMAKLINAGGEVITPHQATFIVVCLLSALVPLIAFVIVRRYFGLMPAFIVLALSMFASLTMMFPIYLGFWADIYSYTAAIGAIFFIRELWGKRRVLPLFLFAAMSSAGLVGHAFEFMYALFAMMLTVVYLLLFKSENKKGTIINLAIVVGFIALLSTLYLVRFDVFAYGSGNTFKLGEVRDGPPAYFDVIKLSSIFWIGTTLGILAIAYGTFRRKFNHLQWAILAYVLFLVFLYFSRFIGVESLQTYRQLYHGWWLLVLPAAIGVSMLSDYLGKRFGQAWVVGTLVAAALIFVSVTSYVSTAEGLTDISSSMAQKNPEWESLAWLRDNTPEDSKVLIFFGLYGQGFDILSERTSTWYPHDETLLYQVCNQTMPEIYQSTFRIFLFSKDDRFKLMNGDLSTEYVQFDRAAYNKPRPLDDFDYVVARYRGTQVDPCIGFYLNGLIAAGHELAWNNEDVAIIKVNHDGN